MAKNKKVVVLITVLAVFIVFTAPVFAEETEKININTATVEELVKLKRVGPKYAEMIIEYRDANGPFQSPEDLMKVKGIGEKTFEVNKDMIAVE